MPFLPQLPAYRAAAPGVSWAGWTVHVLEQFEHSTVIRPLLKYEREMDREYVPIEER